MKCVLTSSYNATVESPSLRGRGLKFFTYYVHDNGNKVALFARAWIEIWVENYEDLSDDTSPSLRGRGLKSQVADLFSLCTSSPSLRGRGLKLSAQH